MVNISNRLFSDYFIEDFFERLKSKIYSGKMSIIYPIADEQYKYITV